MPRLFTRALSGRTLTLVLNLALALACLAPAPARAWTRASVESAEAQLELDAQGEAEVLLVLEVRVSGGWLSRFELTGLERDPRLDPSRPALVRTADGQELTPAVRLRKDGSVVLTFADKKRAPHRGLHRLELRYATPLDPLELPNGARGGLSWSMPAWEADLRHAAIEVTGPKGLRIASEVDSDPLVNRSTFIRDERAVVRLERDQLPRTTVFSTALELPSLRVAGPRAHLRSSSPTFEPVFASLFVLALCLLKRRAVREHARSVGAQPLAFIALAEAPRTLAIGCAAALAAAVYDARPTFALGLLALAVSCALDRGFVRNGKRKGSLREGRIEALSLLFATPNWLDATTPLGAGLLGSGYALAGLRLALGAGPGLWLESILLVTPLFLTATRLHPTFASRPCAAPAEAASSEPVALSAAAASRPAPGRAA